MMMIMYNIIFIRQTTIKILLIVTTVLFTYTIINDSHIK